MDKVEKLIWAQEFIMEDIYALVESTLLNMSILASKVSLMQHIISEATGGLE